MSARHRRDDPEPRREHDAAALLGRLGRRIAASTAQGREAAAARGAALGSVVGDALERAGERVSAASARRGAGAGSAPPAARARRELEDRPATTPVTGERLLAAWQDSQTGRATSIAHVPTGAPRDAPVRLMGVMPGYSFWIGAETDSPLVIRVQAVWDRTLPEEMAATLRRAVNDWNRDHVWPLVWTVASHTGHTVSASAMLDVSHGATDAQLVDHIDVSLAGIDAFFSALDQATTLPGDDTDGPDSDCLEDPDGPPGRGKPTS